MVALLIVVGFMGLIYYRLFGGRRWLSGGFGRERVYLRRGPGLGGIALAVIAFVYLSSHTGQVEGALLIFGVAMGIGVLVFGLARWAIRRNR